jgi:hypothetical protein
VGDFWKRLEISSDKNTLVDGLFAVYANPHTQGVLAAKIF